MAKIIKNTSGESKTWGGMLINAGASYTCQSQDEANRFALDDSFINFLVTGVAEVYSDNTKISGVAQSLAFLGDDIRDADGARIVRSRAFANADGFRFRGASFSDTVAANTTKSIDYQITQERYINGGRLLVSNIGQEDQVTFQVVDKDNILGYGLGVVLDQFVDQYFVPESGNLELRLDYPARIMSGLYLRMIYKSTHADGCKVKCNLYLHWKAS